jgi:ABC-2 type transport system ATP-binding protein
MWLTIRALAERGTTIFLTTQYLEEADRLADQIAILHGGRVVASGTPEELKTMVPSGLVELDFTKDEELVAAERALGDGHELSRVDSKLVVASNGSVSDMADMFIRLNEAGLEPARFIAKEPTLDDVFFQILGEDKEETHANSH